MSRTAIVILNYNGEQLLEKFLPTVVSHSSEAEVIVADNASTDESLSWIRQHCPSVRIIALDQNYGFCGGYNRALREVNADYFLLLNSDIEVTAGWLPPLLNVLDRYADVSAVQPKILSYHRRNEFEHAGAGGGFIDYLGYPYCRGRIFDTVEKDVGQYNDERPVFWSSGACMLIRSKSFHQFGGFDEDYFAHMEEIDLCWKLHRDNQRIMYCGSSVIYHVGAGTLAYGSPRKVFLNFRNGLFMLFKHLSGMQLVTRMPVRVILDIVAALRFFVAGEWSNGAAVVRAHGEFFLKLGREIRKRRTIQSHYPRYSGEGMKEGSIVFEYYVRGHKTFDRLRDQ
ncbi:glycosyltransferase family 2 protein [Chryseolinea sp. T2]|uniref:glycosyltransferase family 2 protein n=1 Tax=Chryseolinea sp. T2 TaxID=3129255 RepID=UPI0030777976